MRRANFVIAGVILVIAIALAGGLFLMVSSDQREQAVGTEPPPMADRPSLPPMADRPAPDNGHPPAARNGGAPDVPEIFGSVYGFVDTGDLATRPVGLRSYVLLTNRAEEARNAAFLAEIFRAAGGAPVDVAPGAPGLQLRDRNVFLVGVHDTGWALHAARAEANVDTLATDILSSDAGYDYDFARDFFRRFCQLAPDSVAPCDETRQTGPYVLTVPDNAGTLSALPARYLVVSLSEVRPEAFRAHVSALLSQVTRPAFEDAADTQALRLAVLDFLLRAGEAVSLTEEAFAKSYLFGKKE